MLDTECGQLCEKNDRLDPDIYGHLDFCTLLCGLWFKPAPHKRKLALNRLDMKFGQAFEILVEAR